MYPRVPQLYGVSFHEYVDNLSAQTLSSGDAESVKQANLSRRERFKRASSSPFAKALQQEAGESWQEFKSRCLYSLLIKQGLRILNKNPDTHRDNLFSLLQEHISYACEELKLPFPVSDYEIATGSAGKTWITWENLDRIAAKAADTAIENWDSSYVERHREMSAKGGRAKKYTLADHLSTAHLTPTEAAKALGVSRPTVYAMRAEFADLDLAIGEIHETTAPQPEPAEPDQVRPGAGDGTRPSSDGMARPVPNRGAGSPIGAHRSPGYREATGGVGPDALAALISPDKGKQEIVTMPYLVIAGKALG